MLSKKLKIENKLWWTIPKEVFLKILLYLDTKDILSFASACKRYDEMCKDDSFWRKLFHRDFNINNHVELKPGKIALKNLSLAHRTPSRLLAHIKE